MQHIQDKDLHKLFKGVFEEAEVTPSKDLWHEISDKVHPKKKTSKLPFFWMAAASLAIVLTVTLMFSKQEKIQLSAESRPQAEESIDFPQIMQENEPVIEERKDVAYTPVPNKVASTSAIPSAQVTTPAVQTVKQTLEIKSVPAVETPEVIAAVQPEREAVVYAQIDTENITTEVINDNEDRRRGIRNVGDIVNLVVEKFDKREKKALRFKTDDDDSSLIGLNIGFLKFNSKKDR